MSGSGVTGADVITVSVESGDPQTAATLADAYVAAYTDVKREQAVDGMVAATAELQTKITELQDRIDTLEKKIAEVGEDDWKLVYLALPCHMYCDVAVRRMSSGREAT